MNPTTTNDIVNVVVVGTGRYFILAIRLINRFNYFYSGNKSLNFYLFSDQDPHGYIDTSNVKLIDAKTSSWQDAVLSKFPSILVAANDECDYVACIDADTTINNFFYDDIVFADLFAMRHSWDDRTDSLLCHESRRKSAAYVDKKTANAYYQSWYFGGKRDKVISMIDDASNRLNTDLGNGIMAVAEDESYLQNYLINNNAKLIDWETPGFPFIGSKGVPAEQMLWGKHISLYDVWPDNKYLDMLNAVKTFHINNKLWDIIDNEIIAT